MNRKAVALKTVMSTESIVYKNKTLKLRKSLLQYIKLQTLIKLKGHLMNKTQDVRETK